MYNIKDSKFVGFGYEDWLRYLKANDTRRLKIDFSNEPVLSGFERKLIFPSISAFQSGEHSDGNYLFKSACEFAKEYDEPFYTETMRFFIKEENFHSSYLASYMSFHGEALKNDIALDGIFRRLRKTMGIYSEIAVLVTAEIIALSYYSALKNVADDISSPALAAICKQMLHDELPHIVLQSHTLGIMPCTAGRRAVRVALMEAAVTAVWFAYGRLFEAGEYNYTRFRDESLGYLYQSFAISEK